MTTFLSQMAQTPLKSLTIKESFFVKSRILETKNGRMVSMALDAVHDSLICGSDKNSVIVVKSDSRIISTFRMGRSLSAIALCKGCYNLVACFREKKFIQILSHRE